MKYDSTPKYPNSHIPTNSKSAPPDQDQNADSRNEIKLPSRRQFLSAAGGITTATLASGSVGLSSLTGASGTVAKADDLSDRDERALAIRINAANYQLQNEFPVPQNNGDEGRYPSRFANYSKGLPHNNLGEVNRNAYQKLLDAIANDDPSLYNAIPLGGIVRLSNPQASIACDLEGADSHSLSVITPP